MDVEFPREKGEECCFRDTLLLGKLFKRARINFQMLETHDSLLRNGCPVSIGVSSVWIARIQKFSHLKLFFGLHVTRLCKEGIPHSSHGPSFLSFNDFG